MRRIQGGAHVRRLENSRSDHGEPFWKRVPHTLSENFSLLEFRDGGGESFMDSVRFPDSTRVQPILVRRPGPPTRNSIEKKSLKRVWGKLSPERFPRNRRLLGILKLTRMRGRRIRRVGQFPGRGVYSNGWPSESVSTVQMSTMVQMKAAIQRIQHESTVMRICARALPV